MKPELRRTCPSCGNEFSGATEFCPICILRKALADGVKSGEASAEDKLKPAPEQAAQRFEHYELVTGEDGKPVELFDRPADEKVLEVLLKSPAIPGLTESLNAYRIARVMGAIMCMGVATANSDRQPGLVVDNAWNQDHAQSEASLGRQAIS